MGHGAWGMGHWDLHRDVGATAFPRQLLLPWAKIIVLECFAQEPMQEGAIGYGALIEM
ncbi:MAG: hypothetical protein F6J93_25855 [Oscillatoria sp. SIO1A7]|nr:hypothetical protein [Oscillatoria sp. SIO1A7]